MKIVIAGNPKSGTTALFDLLADALPDDYLLLFEPRDANGVGDSQNVLAKVLSAGVMPPADFAGFERFDRKIYLMRDPRDTLISAHLYYFYHAPVTSRQVYYDDYMAMLRRKEAEPATVSLLDLWLRQLAIIRNEPCPRNAANLEAIYYWHEDYFARSISRFLSEHPNYFIYKYRMMIDKDFAPLENYLGFPLRRARAAAHNFKATVSWVKREGTYGGWRQWFTPEDVDFYRPLFDPLLEATGYSLGWSLPAGQTIDRRHASDYVRQLIEKNFAEHGPILGG